MDGKVYEMQWDCQFCSTKKLLGKTHRFCPNCGAPQNPESRYFPSDEEKVAVEDHVFVGVDLTCKSCGELNSAASQFCEQCGAALTEGVAAPTLGEQLRAEGEQFESSGSRDVVKERFDAEMERVGVTGKSKGGPNWKIILLVAALLVAICGVVIFLTSTTPTTVVAVGHEWERSILVENYETFRVNSWRDSRPAGDNVSIVLGSCRQEQRSTNRVPDGQECTTRRVDQGDGTFREVEDCQTRYREEPVYDDMCTWSGQSWQAARSIDTRGSGLSPEPAWGALNLNCEGQRRLGCERESSRSENYLLVLRGDEDRLYRCDLPQAEWATAAIESAWTLEIYRVDANNANCGTLARAG